MGLLDGESCAIPGHGGPRKASLKDDPTGSVRDLRPGTDEPRRGSSDQHTMHHGKDLEAKPLHSEGEILGNVDVTEAYSQPRLATEARKL